MTELERVLTEALRLEREGEAGALVTLFESGGSTPRHGLARMVVRADGSVIGTIGGGAVEYAMTKRALEAMTSGEPLIEAHQLKDLNMSCGGAVKVLIEPIGLRPKLAIFGAGHVAAEVAPLAARCGFMVQVVDDRAEFASAERFPDASALVHTFDPGGWGALGLGPTTFCAVMTRGHEHDAQVVRVLIERELAYLGMMGSKTKVAKTRRLLADDGVSPEAIDRLHAPIGLPIPCETPAEIAVSIVGQLIEVRRGAKG